MPCVSYDQANIVLSSKVDASDNVGGGEGFDAVERNTSLFALIFL